MEQLQAERDSLKKHAVKFHANWMGSERANLPAIAFDYINLVGELIGRGSYRVCRLSEYGGMLVAVKEIKEYSESKLEDAQETAPSKYPAAHRCGN